MPLVIAALLPLLQAFGLPEIPLTIQKSSSAKVMLLIDDSGSMNAVVEYPGFNAKSAAALDAANTIPSVIFRLESGASAPTTAQQMRPVLIEMNWPLWGRTGTNIYGTAAFSAMTSHPLVANVACNTSNNSLVNCPAPGATTPQRGSNAMNLFGNTSIVGNSIFAVANLAKVAAVNVTDTSGNEYLYTSYRRNDYLRQSYDFSTVWPNMNASGVNQPYYTTVFATQGGTVVFNGKQITLSRGWYRIEYLRWLFYVATPAELAAIPNLNRMDTVKDVVEDLINNNPTVKFGLSTINGSRVTTGFTGTQDLGDWLWTPDGTGVSDQPKIRANIGTSNASLISTLATLTARGGTPLTNTYIEVLRYFHGEADNDPNANLTYTTPILSACDSSFVVMLTDGLPTGETNNKVFNAWIQQSYDGVLNDGATTNQNCSSNICANFLDDAAWFAYHTDFSTAYSGLQTIRSYAIGFGLNYGLLDEFAVDGGSGHALQANTAEEVSDTLQNIVNSLLSTAVGSAGTAVAEVFGENALVFRPYFKVGSSHWYGGISTFVSYLGDLIPLFDMGQVLAERNRVLYPRKIIAGSDPDFDGDTTTSIDFTTANAATLRPQLFRLYDNSSLSPTLLSPALTLRDNAAASKLIDWSHGTDYTSMKVRNTTGDGLIHPLGDIVNFQPQYVGHQNGDFNAMNGYSTFVKGLSSQPDLLIVGANDGMLHAFDVNDGKELWAYIPSSMLKYLEVLARQDYANSDKRYYVDGKGTARDVYVGGQWRTIFMFGLGGGGSQYIVLDITDRSNPTLLFEVDDVSTLGESWSEPALVLTGGSTLPNDPSTYTWYMVVGTGEDKASAGTYLARYTLQTGTVPAPTFITINASDSTGTSTSSVAPIQDDQVQDTDRLYVGTTQGDLYRINVTGSWTATKLYDGSASQPITARPAAVLVDNPKYVTAGLGAASHPYAVGVYFGTGRYRVTSDITTFGTTAQDIVGIFDPVEITTDTYADAYSNLTKTALKNQSIASFSAVRGSDGIYRVPTTVSGFYLTLDTSVNLASGYINPVGMIPNSPANVRGAIIFATFLPNQNVCEAGGNGFIQVVNFRTGGGIVVDYTNPANPFYNGGIADINSDGNKNATDLSLAYTAGTIRGLLDTKVVSVDLTSNIPYLTDGTIASDDIRLQTTGGAIMPAVSSLGANGIPGEPSVIYSSQQLVVQSAFITTNTGSGGGSGGSGGETETGQVTLCHYPTAGDPTGRHTLSVPQSEVATHVGHGDTTGPCPEDESEDTMVVCYSNVTISIPVSQWAGYQALGATDGSCSGNDPDPVVDPINDAPPDVRDLTMYNIPLDIVSMHEVTGE